MKKTIALLALAASSAAYAQLVSLPPVLPASLDQTPSATALGNFGVGGLWDSQINSLTVSSNGNVPLAGLLAGDGITGGGVAPGVIADLTAVRIINLGETAGWLNDLGITFGAPTVVTGPTSTSSSAHASAKTLTTDIPTGVTPFTYWDVAMTPGLFSSFDIWLNASSSFDGINPTPTTTGGLYHAFHPGWDNPTEGYPKAYWSKAFGLNTNYWDVTTSSIQSVYATTYILSFEDLREGASDFDHSDLILAVQLIGKDGRPNGGVPEPTTYGVLGAAALLAIITVRRRLQK